MWHAVAPSVQPQPHPDKHALWHDSPHLGIREVVVICVFDLKEDLISNETRFHCALVHDAMRMKMSDQELLKSPQHEHSAVPLRIDAP